MGLKAWFDLVTVPSLASVYNEYALKSEYDRSIYLQNLFSYGYGAIFNFLGILVTAMVKGTMVPGIKTGRWKRATSGNVLAASEACQQEIGTLMTFSDETQPPDDTQTVILDRKAYLLYKDWRYNLKQEFLKLEEKGVDDPYSHPPTGANEDGDIDFPEFYKKAHKSKKTGDWIDPKCGELHVTSSAARARDKHMESMRAELEVLREQRQRDHEELLKEKEKRQRDHEELLKEEEERQRDHEELLKEKKERQRDWEEIMREREQLIKQVDEEKKAGDTTSTTQSSERRGAHNPLVGFRWSSYYSVLRHNVSRHCSSRPGVLIHYTKDRNLISIR
ncbi:hypothetical protein TEA_007797 [Camellia sinensis var. sinensis]|uniref:Uncharacterized protein n=1 Tax=Camellia sinensis var. sinensis TaxID=542762 RepID=A0A4S4EDQ7_CAMSN|nr:hypothetical protein TEA_007797 [Camellia sinensis var. sinensis]